MKSDDKRRRRNYLFKILLFIVIDSLLFALIILALPAIGRVNAGISNSVEISLPFLYPFVLLLIILLDNSGDKSLKARKRRQGKRH